MFIPVQHRIAVNMLGMTIKLTIDDQHLALSPADPAVQLSLQQLKETARSFDEVESWIADHLPLFGGIPLQLGDVVQVSFEPHMNDLAKLNATQLFAAIDVDVQRNVVTVPDLGNGFKIYNQDNVYLVKHQVATYLDLSDWPIITAQLLAVYRARYNFDSRPEALEMVRTYLDPFLALHFPGTRFDQLRNMASLELLPEGQAALVDFLFNTRDAAVQVTLPGDFTL